jgi:uncharacterized membrane protein YhaH (DUF805 family)
MGPVQAINSGIRKSWMLSGRSSRSEFWWFSAFLLGIGMISGYFHALATYEHQNVTYLVSLLVPLALFPASMCVTRRRQRDVNPNVPNVSFLICYGIGLPPYYNKLDIFRLGGCVSVAMLLLSGPTMVFAALLNPFHPENSIQSALAIALIFIIVFGWPLPNLLRASAKLDQLNQPSQTGNEVPT